jgi:ketosteroid isomerase-like protein
MPAVFESKENSSMKTVLAIVLASCIASGLQPRAQVQRISADVNAVKEAVTELTDAQLKYDASAVDKLLDAAFVYVANDGSVINRIDFVGLSDRKRNPLDLLEITDIDVRTSGDTAVAIGLIHEKGRLDGKPYEFRSRTLATYVRKSGRWLCLAIHD